MERTVPAAGYETDLALWVKGQSAALREGRFADVDVANVIEELEALAGRDRREIVRRLTLVAMRLLKRQYQPERETRSWLQTIRTQAMEVEDILAESPSLRRELPAFLAKAYRRARLDAADETELPRAAFPDAPTPEFERALRAAMAGDDSPQEQPRRFSDEERKALQDAAYALGANANDDSQFIVENLLAEASESSAAPQ